MRRFYLITLFLVGMALIITACGTSGDNSKTTEKTNNEASATNGTSDENKGVTVAKVILDTFDNAVAEVAGLLKEKPVFNEVKPKLEALYTRYAEKMKALNVTYLALKNEDIRFFGSANSYLGQFRGKHVFKKDEVLAPFFVHYNINSSDSDIKNLLNTELINLLEIAVENLN